MLLVLFLTPIFALIDFFLGLLPTMALPAPMVSYIQTAVALVSSLGAIIPLDTITNVFSVIIAFYGIQFLLSLTNWSFRKIPTLS